MGIVLKKLLIIAFVILTNPLFASIKGYTFDPSSVIQIDFDKKNCAWEDDTAIGCSEATLTFGSMKVSSKVWGKEEIITVWFHDPKDWNRVTFILVYHPAQCELVKTNSGAVRGVCRSVAWREVK